MPYYILIFRRRAAEQGRRRREESERRQRELADDLEAQRAAEEAEKEVKQEKSTKNNPLSRYRDSVTLPYLIIKFKVNASLPHGLVLHSLTQIECLSFTWLKYI